MSELLAQAREAYFNYRGGKIVRSFAGTHIQAVVGTFEDAERLKLERKWQEAGPIYYNLLSQDLPPDSLLKVINDGPQMFTNNGEVGLAYRFVEEADTIVYNSNLSGPERNLANAILAVRKGWIYDNIQLFRWALGEFEAAQEWLGPTHERNMSPLELETYSTADHFLGRQKLWLAILGFDPSANALGALDHFERDFKRIPLLEQKTGEDKTANRGHQMRLMAVACAVLGRGDRSWLRQGGEQAYKALSFFEQAAAGNEWDGNLAHGHLIIGQYDYLAGNKNSARRDFEKALRIRQHGIDTGVEAYPFGYVDAALALARLEFSRGNYREGASLVSKAYKVSPKFTVGRFFIFGCGPV